MKKVLSNLEEIIAGIALTVLIVLVCVNVFLRGITSKSINWMEEVVFLCFAYVIFLGASAAFKRNLHSGVDLVVRVLPKKMQAVVSVLSTLLLFAACLAVTYLSFVFAVSSGMKKTPILRIPYFYIDISATFGFGLMCIHCLSFIKNIFKHHDFFRERTLYRQIYRYDSAEDSITEDILMREGGEEES